VSRHYLVALFASAAAAASCRANRDRTVVTELPTAFGLKENAQVLFRGIEVGRVERLTLAHSGVQLVLRVGRSDAPLRADDRVALRTVGPFGDVAVEIIPGPGSGPPLGDSATLAAAPPDTLAQEREAVAQAVGKAMIAPLLQADSASRSAPGTSPSRP
jgi:ABC-type transporter Mla subunit MlaD